MEHFDVLVVGAGISGLGAAYYLGRNCPTRSYAILEGRERIGGTWDLFRYPGIRSDSDMFTLGYAFKPWTDPKSIADGDAILAYLDETARENDIDRHIRYSQWVKAASWSSESALWTVEVEDRGAGETRSYTCCFLFMCSGYYDYDEGYTPVFEGIDRFEGQVVHPQKWNDEIEYGGKRVIIIGSGATAVTLLPELAKKTEHVTMLQRSPTYMMTPPAEDPIANALRRSLPPMVAYQLTRWRNVLMGMYFFQMSRRRPEKVKRFLLSELRKQLPDGYDIEKHFTPNYNPWDQRICAVPDGDLFAAIREGRATVVTDHIETFTDKGILLKSGEELEADMVITATGLKLLFLAGLKVSVDGRPVDPSDSMTYKAMMFSDLPNLAASFGYTNASWTLKSDLTGEYVCRLLNHMERHGHRVAVPRQTDPSVTERPFLDFTSGYIQRNLKLFPKQGSKAPWKLDQNYALDILNIRHSKIDDGVMQFS